MVPHLLGFEPKTEKSTGARNVETIDLFGNMTDA